MTYPPPGQYPAPHGGPPPRAPRRAWWKTTPAIAAAALLIGLGVGAAGGSSSKKAAATKTTTTSVTATATQSVPGPTTVVTTTPVVQKVIATRTRTVTETYTPPPVGVFSDGTYKVGADLKPGQYKTDGQGDGSGCYYERDHDLNGSIDSIINNDNFDGPTRLQINRGEYVKVSGGCEWHRV